MAHETLPSFATVFGLNIHSTQPNSTSEPFNSGKWTAQEEEDFLAAVKFYGTSNVNSIQAMVGTRSRAQVRGRISKFKLQQEQQKYAARYRNSEHDRVPNIYSYTEI